MIVETTIASRYLGLSLNEGQRSMDVSGLGDFGSLGEQNELALYTPFGHIL